MTLQIVLPHIDIYQPYASLLLILFIYLIMCRIYYMRVVFYIRSQKHEYQNLLKIKDALIKSGDNSFESHEKLNDKIDKKLESKQEAEYFLEFMSVLWPVFVLYELVCFFAVLFFKVFLLVTLGTCKLK